MITTIFRSRLNQETLEEYQTIETRMVTLAQEAPGFISIKAFTAEDGERLSIVEFESWDTMRQWKNHPGHQKAQALGRDSLYTEYSLSSFEQSPNNPPTLQERDD